MISSDVDLPFVKNLHWNQKRKICIYSHVSRPKFQIIYIWSEQRDEMNNKNRQLPVKHAILLHCCIDVWLRVQFSFFFSYLVGNFLVVI